jgi:hypothetical protein
MTVEEVRTRLRARLEAEYGVDEASILMDRPPGGWGDLATHESVHREVSELERRIDLRFEAFEARMDARFSGVDTRFVSIGARLDAIDHRFEELEANLDHRFDRFEHQLLGAVDRRLRTQTWWTVGTILTTMGILVGLVKL